MSEGKGYVEPVDKLDENKVIMCGKGQPVYRPSYQDVKEVGTIFILDKDSTTICTNGECMPLRQHMEKMDQMRQEKDVAKVDGKDDDVGKIFWWYTRQNE